MQTTKRVSRASRHQSLVPGYFTRAQVEQALGLTPAERDNFERSDTFGPAERRQPGDTRPVLYSSSDLAVARVALAVNQLGIRGQELRRVTAGLRLKQRRLVPGWRGVALIAPHGDVSIVPDGGDLAAALAEFGDNAVIIARIDVPQVAL